MAQVFDHPAFPVDTHIHRLAQRWKLTSGKSVVQTERDLKRHFAKERWNDCIFKSSTMVGSIALPDPAMGSSV
jgi:endonuclease III